MLNRIYTAQLAGFIVMMVLIGLTTGGLVSYHSGWAFWLFEITALYLIVTLIATMVVRRREP